MQLFNGTYKLEERLGSGASAEVWKATDTLTNTTLALKIYSPGGNLGTNGHQLLAHEFKIMVNANHRNLLKPLHFAIDNNRPFLVMPYCPQGNIDKFKGTLGEEQVWRLLCDVAGGLAYLHDMKPPLIHQDIKPANILIADNGDFMLTDFGVSTHAKANINKKEAKDTLSAAGTIAYMAPEKFTTGSAPIMASDVWSLGATVYEMMTGQVPFGNSGGLSQNEGTPMPEVPPLFDSKLTDLVLSCLKYRSWDRPRAKNIYEQASEALKKIAFKKTENDDNETVLKAHQAGEISETLPQAKLADGISEIAKETQMKGRRDSQEPTVEEDGFTPTPWDKTIHAKEPEKKDKDNVDTLFIASIAVIGLAAGIILALIL